MGKVETLNLLDKNYFLLPTTGVKIHGGLRISMSNSDKQDRVITSTQLRYDITSWLYASGRVGMDYYQKEYTTYP